MKIPLIRLLDVERFLADSGRDRGEYSPSLDVDSTFPSSSFALNLADFDKNATFPEKGAAVFSMEFGKVDAVEQVFLLRFSPDSPRLCRMVRSEQQAGTGKAFRASRRKSFMTPTPLHIPTSQVSPIPDYTHSVFYLKLFDQEKLEIVSTGQTARLLPLVSILSGVFE